MEPHGLGESLRVLRTARGLGMSEAARRAGVSRSALQHWEAGRNVPAGAALARLLDALEADARLRARLVAGADPRHAQIALAGTALGPPVPLGTVLRAMRARRGMTQADLARAAGVTQSAVAKWESGDSAPSASTLHHAAFALGAAPEEALALASVRGEADPFLREKDPESALLAVDGSPIGALSAYNGFFFNGLFETLAAAYEAEAWRRAARDPRWDPVLCRVIGRRAAAAYHRGDPGFGGGLARRAIRLARTPDAKRASMDALDIATEIAKRRGDDPARAAALTGAWADALPPGGAKVWALWIRALRLNAMRQRETALAHLRIVEEMNAQTNAWMETDHRTWHLAMNRVEFHLSGGDAKAALDAIEQAPLHGSHYGRLARVYHANGLAAPQGWMEAARDHHRSWPSSGPGRIHTWRDVEHMATLERDQDRLSRRAA